MNTKSKQSKASGYTLVEALVAAGILTAAMGGASALSMATARQEQMSRDRAAALHYAESLGRIWQLGVNSTAILVTPRNYDGTPMTANAPAASSVLLPVETGPPVISQGSLEKVTITVSYKPYFNTSMGTQPTATVSLDVYRPQSSHR